MTCTVVRHAVHDSFCDGFRTRIEELLTEQPAHHFPGCTIPLAASTRTYADILASQDMAANVERVLRPLVSVPAHPADSITIMRYVKESPMQGATVDHVDLPVNREHWDTAEIAMTISLGLGGKGASIIAEGQYFDLAKGDALLIPGSTPHRIAPVQEVPLYRVVMFFCKDKETKSA